MVKITSNFLLPFEHGSEDSESTRCTRNDWLLLFLYLWLYSVTYFHSPMFWCL